MPETKFDVGMTCEGCAGAIKRILGKVPGVTVIETDVAAKSVVVMHDDNVSSADIDAKLQKWSASSGKPVSLSS